MLWRRDLEAEIQMTIFIARVQLTATAPWLAIRPHEADINAGAMNRKS